MNSEGEELLLMNNEQANALRAASKEIAVLKGDIEARQRDDAIYDELSQVNNELANLQREMVRKNIELSKLNEEKNHFLGMAAHDLRSPLGVILSYAEFLEAEAQLNEEHREFLATIKKTSHFMLALVEDLLDVSAIESGQLDLRIAPTDLVELVARNATLHRALAAPKHIEIAFTPPETRLPPVHLDPEKFEQVLYNLVSNAVKYSPPGSRVEISVGHGADGASVSVRDQGPGIPAAELPKLFKPFGRTSVRSTSGEKSTGLGLVIVRRIVEGHGGSVGVESEVGRGSVFRVVLPVPPIGIPAGIPPKTK